VLTHSTTIKKTVKNNFKKEKTINKGKTMSFSVRVELEASSQDGISASNAST
jgi:hypothetical protein